MKPGSIRIRQYHGGDRDALHRIAADTAFFGEPVEKYLDDRRIFIDALYRYYTEYERDHCWMASVGEDVIGFLAGCPDTRRQRAIMVRRIVPNMLRRWISGSYQIGARTRKHYLRLVGSAMQGEVPHTDLATYPAHLHINVDKDWRGVGIGTALLETYFKQLGELGVEGVHLHTTDRNRTACRLYERMGMHVWDARKTRLWEGVLGEAVENRVYVLRLDDNSTGQYRTNLSTTAAIRS